MGLNLPRRALVRTDGIGEKSIGAYVHLFFHDAPGRTAVDRRVAYYFRASVLPSCATFFVWFHMHFVVRLGGSSTHPTRSDEGLVRQHAE